MNLDLPMIRFPLAAVLLLGTLSPAFAESGRRQQIADALPGWLQDSGTPSAAVAWIDDGRLRWTVVAGERAEGQPADDETRYNVASLTKPVTAEVVLRAVAAGMLSLDAPLDDHFVDPDLADDPQRALLSARLCLSHQCGFPNWRRDTEGRLRIQWPPGSRAGYSGEGFEYVAHALQAATGTDLQRLAERLLFDPEGMHGTSYVRRADAELHVAVPHGAEGAAGTPDLRDSPSAADDLHATIADFGRFAAAVLRGDRLPATLAAERWRIDHDVAGQLCVPGRLQGDQCPVRMGFALGWVRYETDAETVYFHGGGDWGERAFVLLVPDRAQGIVVLTNGAGGMAVVRNVVAALYDNPAIDAFLRMQAEG